MGKKLQIDDIYITNPQGIIESASEQGAVGLNIYEVDPLMRKQIDEKLDFEITPLKTRVEDNELYKFMMGRLSDGRVVEIGKSYKTLQNILKQDFK